MSVENGLKVLIVDDEADIVEVLQDRLEAYGFTVASAATGRQGMDRLSREHFDGVFLDLRMPEMDGMEALTEIRKRDPRLPVIIITASSMKDAAVEALRRGANGYLLKPFDWHDLRVRIQEVYGIALA